MKMKVEIDHDGYRFVWWVGSQYVRIWLPGASFNDEWSFQFLVPTGLSSRQLHDPGEGFFEALERRSLEWIRDYEAEEAEDAR